MEALTTFYWVTFGVGLVYVLIAGTLGAVSHGIEALGDAGIDADVDHDVDFDVDHDVDFDVDHDVDFDVDHDVDFDVDHDVDLDLDHDVDFDHDAGAGFDTAHEIGATSADLDVNMPAADLGHETAAHADTGLHGAIDAGIDQDFAGIQAAQARERQRSLPRWNPFSPLSIAGFLAAFGGAGLLATGYGLPWMLTVPLAAGGGLVMSFILWLIIGKLMFSMQGSSEAHVIDMLGLEAEVLTPVEHDMSGEIAYILEGTRYTAPARLIDDGRIEKREKVRIRKMCGNMVYVEPHKKLLS